MALEINQLETRRFGVICAKLNGMEYELPDLAQVNAEARSKGITMVSTRLHVSQLALVHALEEDGYRLMDTIVYYKRSLVNLPEEKLPPKGIILRSATPADAKGVAHVSRAAFQGYFGHYHADPRLDNAAADAAYIDWAEHSVERIGNKMHAMVVEHGTRIVGFATLAERPTGAADIELNGILPEHQGVGLYGCLIDSLMHFSVKIGAACITSSTQINNYGVQRVWTRRGFVHESSLYTLHKWFDRPLALH